MNKILLILSTSRTSDKAVDFAVDKAHKEGKGLIALYVIDSELTNEIFDKFTDIGFIGDKPSMELTKAVMKEYRQRGYEEIGRVQVKAMESGVDFDAVTVDGDFVEEALKLIDTREVSVAVVVRRKTMGFMKYFSRSMCDELEKQASCEVVVFDADKDND
jgi:nucleotide-binding universal stress UspA family protein